MNLFELRSESADVTNTLDLILVWFSTLSIGFEPQTVCFAAGGCSLKASEETAYQSEIEHDQIQW